MLLDSQKKISLKQTLPKNSVKNLCIIIFSLLISLLGFYNCTSDDEYSTENTETETHIPATFFLDNQTHKRKDSFKNTESRLDGKSIVIVAKKEEWKPKEFSNTRTSWSNSDNIVNWTEGDQIGVFMQAASGIINPVTDRNNVQYNIQTGNSASSPLIPNSSPIYFPSSTNPMMKFFAYYPYSATNNSLLINYTLPTDQSTTQQLSVADLMNATSSATTSSNPNVSLAFDHQMVLLSFQIKTSLSPATLTKVTVSGTSVTNTGTLNLSTSILTPNTSAKFAPYVTTNQPVGPNTYAYVDIIINPCTITSNLLASQFKVTLDFKGILSHSTNLNIIRGVSFEGGTRNTYNISVAISL